MLTLVTGGAASGKSEWAEHLIRQTSGKRFYIATMMPFGDEAEERIQKHRDRRAQDGYETLECYTDLAALKLPQRGSVLLDCLGNLVANEMFSPDGEQKNTQQAVLTGIRRLAAQSDDLILVTNEVFSGGQNYAGETLQYMKVLGALNCAAAAEADRVYEVVCGIPHCLKGRQQP